MNKHFYGSDTRRCTVDRPVAAPAFRRRFTLEVIPDRAEFSVCGLGFYLLWVNGTPVTKGALAPYISNPDDICYYDTYDLVPYLREGENVISLILGNGFMNPFGGEVWDFHLAAWIGAPRVAFEFCAYKEDRAVLQFEADEKLVWHPSAILMDEIRLGELYDAREELPGWQLTDFDDSGWKPAIPMDAPRGDMRICHADPIRVQAERKPVEIVREGEAYRYDFGVNSAGIFRLKIKAKPGQKITMKMGERLLDGKFDNKNLAFRNYDYYDDWTQSCVYIAKGEGEEVYEPHFTYFGYRYILVEGITQAQATEELLTYIVMNSDLRRTGGFSCSDPVANTLFAMAQNSDLSNFYYFPTDCPHREKNGWTGDASASASRMVMLYDSEKSLCQWLDNIRKAQNDEGAVPGIVPTGGWGFKWGNGPAWDRVLFELPYMIYRYRGNTQVIRDNAHAMMRYLDYILKHRRVDGTVAIGLGDWVPTGKSKANDYDAPLALTDSIMVMEMAHKAEEMFRAVGYTHQAEFAHGVWADMRQTVRRVLLDRETMTMAGNCQTSQALALYYGVFDEEERRTAFDRLLERIHADGDSFTCGFLGLQCIFDVLSEFGESELAYRMITKPDYPSYACLIGRGETSVVEAIRPDTMDCGSHNHHFLCDYARWFVNCVAGLRVIDSRTVEVKPSYISSLNYAEAYCDLPAGRVTVRWERLPDGTTSLKVDSPKDIRIC